MVDTIKFSEFIDGGDLEPNQITAGLENNQNTIFSNPFPLLPPGSTAERPAPAPAMYFRLRFNTTLQSYEYYSSVAMDWVQLEDSIDVQTFPFVIYTDEPLLPSAFNLGSLTGGILKQSVLSGVATPAIAQNGVDYYGPGYTGYLISPSGFADANGNPIVHVNTIGALAANYLGVTNSSTGLPVLIAPEGPGANIDIGVLAKNAAKVLFGSTLSTAPFVFSTGTAYQHITNFNFPNTANTVDVTWQDASGTVAYVGDLSGYVQSVTGTANEIDVDNTDPQNPILSLASVLILPGTLQVGSFELDTNFLSSSSTMNFEAATPNYVFLASAAAPAELRIREQTTNGSDYFSLRPPANLAASWVWVTPDNLPVSNPSINITSTAGVMTWRNWTSGVSWTPVLVGSVTPGSPTGTFDGRVMRRGSMVFITGRFVLTGLGGISGNISIQGIPFPCITGVQNRAVLIVGFRSNWTNDFVIGGFIQEATSTVQLYNMQVDFTTVTDADLSATSQLYFSLVYETSSS